MVFRCAASLLLLAAVQFSASTSLAGDEASAHQGRPTAEAPTGALYDVWSTGKTWHVRWTAADSERSFSGRVTADGGELTGIDRVDAERSRKAAGGGKLPQDRVELVGERAIHFSSSTGSDSDGFDFTTSEAVTSLRFVLEVDSAPAARVRVGRGASSPGTGPFTLKLE